MNDIGQTCEQLVVLGKSVVWQEWQETPWAGVIPGDLHASVSPPGPVLVFSLHGSPVMYIDSRALSHFG